LRLRLLRRVASAAGGLRDVRADAKGVVRHDPIAVILVLCLQLDEHERRLEAYQRQRAELFEAVGDERHRRRVGQPNSRAKDFRTECSL